jgi:hypothetical protein
MIYLRGRIVRSDALMSPLKQLSATYRLLNRRIGHFKYRATSLLVVRNMNFQVTHDIVTDRIIAQCSVRTCCIFKMQEKPELEAGYGYNGFELVFISFTQPVYLLERIVVSCMTVSVENHKYVVIPLLFRVPFQFLDKLLFGSVDEAQRIVSFEPFRDDDTLFNLNASATSVP